MGIRYIFVLFFFCFALIEAKEIEFNKAENIAVKWIERVTKKRLTIIKNRINTLKNYRKTRLNSTKEPYYIFNLASGGWVIVADDDINSQVLAYSDKSSLDPHRLPPQFRWWLKNVSNELKKAKNLVKRGKSNLRENLFNKEKPQAANGTYISSNTLTPTNRAIESNKGVGPLLSTSWGQGRGYNEYCPLDSRSIEGNSHVPAGCVAVAMAQIMNYFAWPPRGIGSNSYVPKSNPKYGRQYVNFGNSSYSWRSSEKARVIYHSGISVNMDYGPYYSSAYISKADRALRANFRYKTSGLIKKGSDSSWDKMLIASLDRGSPVLYQGKGDIVHVFVCDGYKKVDGGYMYHFNWGWGGNSNGWFRIDRITPYSNYSFNSNNYAIFNIYPNDPAYGTSVKRSSASVSLFAPLMLFLLTFIGVASKKR